VLLQRDLIVALAARHRLPAVYPYRSHVISGGLICYGPDTVDQLRRAAQYRPHSQGREADLSAPLRLPPGRKHKGSPAGPERRSAVATFTGAIPSLMHFRDD
jgi:hypothetical protein